MKCFDISRDASIVGRFWTLVPEDPHKKVAKALPWSGWGAKWGNPRVMESPRHGIEQELFASAAAVNDRIYGSRDVGSLSVTKRGFTLTTMK